MDLGPARVPVLPRVHGSAGRRGQTLLGEGAGTVRVVRSVGLVVVVSLPWSLANELASFVGVQTGPPALPPRTRGG